MPERKECPAFVDNGNGDCLCENDNQCMQALGCDYCFKKRLCPHISENNKN